MHDVKEFLAYLSLIVGARNKVHVKTKATA